jgi:hypothetical protein
MKFPGNFIDLRIGAKHEGQFNHFLPKAHSGQSHLISNQFLNGPLALLALDHFDLEDLTAFLGTVSVVAAVAAFSADVDRLDTVPTSPVPIIYPDIGPNRYP